MILIVSAEVPAAPMKDAWPIWPVPAARSPKSRMRFYRVTTLRGTRCPTAEMGSWVARAKKLRG